MTSTLHRLLPLLIASVLFPSFSQAQQDEEKVIAFWQTSQSTVSEAVSTPLRDTVGGRDIIGTAATTARILADAGAPGGKALVFDGQQTEPLKTSGKVTHPGNVALTLWVRPEFGAPFQSIVYFYRSFELRYFQNQGQIKLIVWPEGETRTVELGAPVKVGVWNAIHASVRGRTMELLVNGRLYSSVIPADRPTVPPFSGFMTIGHGNERPFKGGLAEIMLSSLSKSE